MFVSNSLRAIAIRFAIAAVAVAGLTPGARAQGEDWNKVIAEAKKEGKLVLYTSQPNQDRRTTSITPVNV